MQIDIKQKLTAFDATIEDSLVTAQRRDARTRSVNVSVRVMLEVYVLIAMKNPY